MGPSRTPLRMGLLGCAEIAWRNALPAMARVPEMELTACASRDRAKAERFATRFGGVPVEGYERLLARTDIDAVYIPLPTGLHHRWAHRALSEGKHVLVEKPLAGTLAEAEDLVKLAARRGLWAAENFTFVHHSQHAFVRELTAGGAIGRPRSFSAAYGIPPREPDDIRYRADLGGGALLDLGSYLVRAARLFLGDGLRVLGSVLRTAPGEGSGGGPGDGVDLGGSALLCSGEGVPADLAFSFQTSYRSAYTVWGSSGRLTLERAFSPPPTLRTVLRVERQDHVEELTLAADDQFANGFRRFAEAVRGGADFGPQGQELLEQAELLDHVRDSACRVPAHG
ncbi:gfo/Idh/MocA family oxidoreductase [Streptomyces armeniacus]|uniref:Gfo/Idh/MocA family oxidoreductase n=1 Tax=Streptomyces armeniacus TaxID=83291 RepID=A0A345XNZ2_9ACTN|nr:Gfo/Idh/MocA family oxidoreductase [Streptomyces armeniacus]AXK33358.1 gfo/Idh/MocA family oxidoreductase [Streptomyces armeniacus]